DLGQRCQIEDRVGSDSARVRAIGEASDCACGGGAVMNDRIGGAGESARSHAFAQQSLCGCEGAHSSQCTGHVSSVPAIHRAMARCKLASVSVTIFGFFPPSALIYVLEAQWPSR